MNKFGRLMDANIAEHQVPVNADIHNIDVIFRLTSLSEASCKVTTFIHGLHVSTSFQKSASSVSAFEHT